MENYVKAVLYVYPRMGNFIEEYRQHIENKAVLSYDGKTTAWKLAEYIAGEIIDKDKLTELKGVLDECISKLTAEEKLLLDVRYFGKMDRVRRIFAAKRAGIGEEYMQSVPYWSERGYYRKQEKVLKKVQSALAAAGITKEKFLEEYVALDGVAPVYQYLELGKDLGFIQKEKEFLRFLEEVKK